MNTLEILTETTPKPRLGRADWLRAAMLCFMKEGIDAVQITRLSTSMGASRGSFYWHFKSRQELLDGLLDEWFAVNGKRIKQVLEHADSLDHGVLSFFAVWTNPDNFNSPLEQAVRDWARLDKRVLKVVRGEDANRIAVIAALFERFDYLPQEAVVRARVLYFAQVGYLAMNPEEAIEERMSMLDDYYFAFTGKVLDAEVGSSFRSDWIAFSKIIHPWGKQMLHENKPRRSGGRRRAQSDAGKPVRATDYVNLRHPFQPQAVFSDDEIANIHNTALRVIEELGIKVLLPEARMIFRQAGARVEDEMVFIGRDIVTAALQTAPASIRLRAANPKRALTYENGAMLFMAGAGCPNATDLNRGRRPGDLEAYVETLKLAQTYDVIHMLGPCVEPQDVPIQFRHYEMMRAQLTHCDKPMFVYARGSEQVNDSFEMIRLALNLSDDDFTDGVWGTTVINSNSPRLLDIPMAQGLIDFARAGQMTIITPFCLAGAMAPITVAGALTLQHAEALTGITLAQLTRAGAPISYGGFSSNVDMKSGSPAFGTPEHVKMQIGAGQLARHIGLPWRSATGAASNAADMQAANETNMAIWGGAMANATLTVHAAGWLEGGLSFGYEKFINDVEALQTMAELCVKPVGNDAEIGFYALAEVDPGGHFFATQHTMDRYQSAFYAPLVSDLTNFGAWTEAGAKTSTQRATDIWTQNLAEFKDPEHGASAASNIEAFVETRKQQGGAFPQE